MCFNGHLSYHPYFHSGFCLSYNEPCTLLFCVFLLASLWDICTVHALTMDHVGTAFRRPGHLPIPERSAGVPASLIYVQCSVCLIKNIVLNYLVNIRLFLFSFSIRYWYLWSWTTWKQLFADLVTYLDLNAQLECPSH
jgi:hypothetical protein